MTSAYERTPSVQTLGEEEGRLEVSFTGDLKKCHLFLSGFVRNLYSSCQSTIGDVDLNFEDRISFSEREHERQRQRAGIRLKKCPRR